MKKSRKKLLLVYHFYSSFVRKDYEILSEKYEVKKYYFRNSKNLPAMLGNFIKFFLFLLLNIFRFDYIFCWFADYHSFLPVLFAKIFGKKSFLVLGGYDVTYIPELNYGSFNSPLRSLATGFSIKNASLNLPVAERLKAEILQRFPRIKTEVVPTGYSPDYFVPDKNIKKENIVLTCGKIDSYKRFVIKGIDLFWKAAELLPQYTFVILDITPEMQKLIEPLPKNLKLLEMIPQKEVIKFYQKAKVYAQFSLREGFPNSVCEAMLCECIPVGTDVGAMKEIIGNNGFLLKSRDISEIVQTIEKAINAPLSLGKKAREQIKKKFTVEQRKEKLYQLLETS